MPYKIKQCVRNESSEVVSLLLSAKKNNEDEDIATSSSQNDFSEANNIKQQRYNIELVIPQQPFQTMEDILNFEKQLQEDPNLFASFEMELKTVGKKPNFTKNCWRKLLVDKLAEKLCWKGTEQNKSVRSLSTSKSIRNAAISIGIEEDEFIRNTKSFFQFAKNRQESKEKYK
ncbi:uncharacterized protein LOC120781780 [Bactrocera tryoni]|uniref:uncharacterized protein LOC120781780 n=1 Tax=Bactrocera tryoni TaxID=59916 RepID=UPI001A96CB70|nr:uncharacterized protein LOC120781780 [Bactrocera tryoni]